MVLPLFQKNLRFVFCLFHMQAPLAISANYLIAIRVPFSETVKIALQPLFSTNERGCHMDKTDPAQGGTVRFRSPGENCILFPFLPTSNTFYTELVHSALPAKRPVCP